ncbi:protein BUNDLE SHEATH DEFECTIVE 2, chloroplastic-like [Pistacia vera]|uniref:protein BUNDLE SHEATH DEFECTIVE 2, chloroplastic-like n=1 Tax=Pistacia vera TaxID=55513 RepID=UPI001263D082|nr:protein BUNDLE SHEATH DEFECTIVE 2, chloroplastic-like [Pistacia vera]
MASASSFAPALPSRPTLKPRTLKSCTGFIMCPHSTTSKLRSVKAKAAANNGNTKPKSVIWQIVMKCAVIALNARGKKDSCVNCNGAGFVGGFMSTFDE